MNLYKFETIKKLEIDCTSYCNAFCGACDRNIDGGENHPNLKLNHISIDEWRSFVTVDNLQNIQEIIFNGNFGDFSMHPHFIDMMEILAEVKTDVYLNLNTNGGARNTKFWNDLAVVLQKFDKHDIKWGIDGLEETHDLYRRGINWDKRIANLCAFNDAGGNSIWKCVVFDYNKADIDTISEFAKSSGCLAFQTNRNRSDVDMKAYKEFPAQKLSGPDTNTFTTQYARRDTFRSHVATPSTLAVNAAGSFSCPYAEEGMLQIDPWGNIWPCCYISGRQLDNRTNFNYKKYKNNHIRNANLKVITQQFVDDLYPAWQRESIDICNKCGGKEKPAPIYNTVIK